MTTFHRTLKKNRFNDSQFKILTPEKNTAIVAQQYGDD